MDHPPLPTAWLSVKHRPLLLRRVHSASGALALGGFLLIHLWTQGQALNGWSAYNRVSESSIPVPVRVMLELLLVYLPLLYHALYGLRLALLPRPNFSHFPFRKDWAWALQRLSGAVALVFIAHHCWQYRWQVWLGRLRPADYFPQLCAELSGTTAWGFPLAAFGYLFGTAACIVHFCNGLSGFCFLWGLTRTRRSIRVTEWACGLLGVLLFAYSSALILFFATGARPMDLVR